MVALRGGLSHVGGLEGKIGTQNLPIVMMKKDLLRRGRGRMLPDRKHLPRSGGTGSGKILGMAEAKH